MLHGKDFIVKLPRTTSSDESNNCIVSSIASVNEGLNTKGSAISSFSAIETSGEFSQDSEGELVMDNPIGTWHKINSFGGLL